MSQEIGPPIAPPQLPSSHGPEEPPPTSWSTVFVGGLAAVLLLTSVAVCMGYGIATVVGPPDVTSDNTSRAANRELPPPPEAPPSACTPEGPVMYAPKRKQKLTVHRHPGADNPVVVFVHEGAFTSGEHPDHSWLPAKLCAVGYTTVDVEYRSGPEFPFPAAKDDVRDAILYTVEHAAEWGIDPERIGLMGASAGGFVALTVGMDTEAPVAAVAALYAPSALYLPAYRAGHPEVWTFLQGASPTDESVRGMATKESPPTLFLMGSADLNVPLNDNQQSVEALKAQEVDARLTVYEGAGHNFLTVASYRDRALTDVVAFFREAMTETEEGDEAAPEGKQDPQARR